MGAAALAKVEKQLAENDKSEISLPKVAQYAAEGFQLQYDQVMPREMNKLLKEFGIQVKTESMDARGRQVEVWSFDINEKLENYLKQGGTMTMFQPPAPTKPAEVVRIEDLRARRLSLIHI